MHTLRLLWAAHHENLWMRRQRRYIRRRELETVDEMPDNLFKEHFRLNKLSFKNLCIELRASTELKGSREIPLEIKIRSVLCALSFFATGSYQRIVGITQHLTQRTTSRCIQQVLDALNHSSILGKYIVFPQTPQERAHIKAEFHRKYNLPGVIGCIDCTHVAIIKPANDEHLYFNRKGFHSLNVQMVCNHNFGITNVNAKFGGATHDSYIWSTSKVEPYMRTLHQSGEHVWLLGDSGYPQRPWLMTPILDAPPGSPAEEYTSRHVQARNSIERCFGLLKAHWRCLLRHKVLHYHPYQASRITLACCVLHNIAIKAALPAPSDIQAASVNHDSDHYSQPAPIDGSQNELFQGRAMLNHLISRL